MNLGNTLIAISPQGLGCMSMSEFYGTPLEDKEGIRLIRLAFNHGINFIDTADVYGYGRNEILVGKAISSLLAEGVNRESVCIATKYAIIRDEHDTTKRGIDNSYDYTLRSCQASLDRLGTDVAHIDLFYVHRIANHGKDLNEAMRAMAELLQAGKIKSVGLSEANTEQINLANDALLRYTQGRHSIAAVQSEYSLLCRVVEKNGVLDLCRKLNISFIAYSPLSRALLTGEIETPEVFNQNDFRSTLPRFSTENIEHNLKIVNTVKDMASQIGCTPAQLALAWLNRQGVVPIPGTTKEKNLMLNIGAKKIALTEKQNETLKRLKEAKGYRYSQAAMKAYGLDDELEE